MTIQKYSKAGKDAYRYVTWYVDEDGSRKQKKLECEYAIVHSQCDLDGS